MTMYILVGLASKQGFYFMKKIKVLKFVFIWHPNKIEFSHFFPQETERDPPTCKNSPLVEAVAWDVGVPDLELELEPGPTTSQVRALITRLDSFSFWPKGTLNSFYKVEQLQPKRLSLIL